MAAPIFGVALVLSSFFLLAVILPNNTHCLRICAFDAIYQLGDSTSDTGNYIRENPSSVFARFPYGENFFNKSTGRCSDGMLMIDFIATSAGLPLLDAYLNPNGTFSRGHGVNFAVAGSTALPVDVLAERKIISLFTNSSLNTQLDWMFTYFNGICYDDQDCAEKLKKALFIVGEIGGNDYSYALFQGRSIEEVKEMVLDVIRAIKDAIWKTIGYGARHVIVPGHFPIGCLPIYLTEFRTDNSKEAYDEFHCLKSLNDLSSHHNDHLKQAIKELKNQHPNVTIAYGDYYNAFRWILSHAPLLGFDRESLQKACCGTGGDYDFSLSKMCGHPDVAVCPHPHRHIHWDGVHLTQKAYRHMAMWILRDIFPKLQCSV